MFIYDISQVGRPGDLIVFDVRIALLRTGDQKKIVWNSRKACVFYEQPIRFLVSIDPNHPVVVGDSSRLIRKFYDRDLAVLQSLLPTAMRWSLDFSFLCIPPSRPFDLLGLFLVIPIPPFLIDRFEFSSAIF